MNCECPVIGFDIDGALTEDRGKRLFRDRSEKCDAPVGIVTARPEPLAEEFVEENDLNPDFVISSQLKHTELPEGSCYYGSWERDHLHAILGGWQYEEV